MFFYLTCPRASFSQTKLDPHVSKSSAFKTIAIVGKPDVSDQLVQTLSELYACLIEHQCEVLFDKAAGPLVNEPGSDDLCALAEKSDLVIVVGGDGTLLHCAREIVPTSTPILGINLGRLGFLVDISPTNVCEVVSSVLAGHYEADDRTLLECQVGNQKPQLAMNDVVLQKWNVARMIEFETWINGSSIDSQRSDGIVISTPTGSTAYALSGGGPLLSPSLDAISLVPICPHTLSNRPIVVPGNTEIQIGVCGKTDPQEVRVSCDGQEMLELKSNEKVTIRKFDKPLRLLHPAGHDHYKVLRTKLGWGSHPKTL